MTPLQTISKYKGVVVVVDFREGGGEAKGLHEICDEFNNNKLPYFVRHLDVGDYLFFINTSDNPLDTDYKVVIILIKKKILILLLRFNLTLLYLANYKNFLFYNFILCK